MEESYEVDPTLDLQCDVCGMREYYVEGGYYYCSICNTQSQQSRHFVEEEQEFNPGTFRSTVSVLQTSEAGGATGNAASESAVKLSSWEVYNIILKTMVDRLIEAGYPGVLKDKVLELFSGYLKRREAIFVSMKAPRLSKISLREPKMNIYAMYGKAPTPRKKWGTREMERKQEREARLEQTNNVGMGSMKKLKAKAKRRAFIEEYLEQSQASDSAFEDPGGSSKRRKISKKKKEARLSYSQSLRQLRAAVPGGKKVVPASTYPRTQRLWKYFQPETFTMKSVLILIFVALRQTGCKILFSDVLRFYTEGILKIESIVSVLHEDEIKTLDLKCDSFLRRKTYDIQNCGSSVDQFLKYMEISNFPYPSVVEFTPKFIDLLKLPREFESLFLQLNATISIEDVFKYRRHKSNHQTFPELLILPMIAVLLKLLFGLDDTTEKYQSHFARLVNKLIDTAVQKGFSQSQSARVVEESQWSRLFVPEDWFLYHRQADSVTRREKLSQNTGKGRSAGLNLPYHLGHSTSTVSKNSKSVIESCNAIKSMFGQLNPTEPQGSSSQFANTLTSEPLILSTGIPREDVIQAFKKAHENSSNQSQSNPINALLQDFTKSRIDYVIQPEKYIAILNKAGYKVKVIPGDARNCNKISFKQKNTIPLFQPYKLYDDFTGPDPSQSLKYLLSLYSCVFSGSSSDNIQDLIKSKIDCIGNAYCCMSLDTMFPLALPSTSI